MSGVARNYRVTTADATKVMGKELCTLHMMDDRTLFPDGAGTDSDGRFGRGEHDELSAYPEE